AAMTFQVIEKCFEKRGIEIFETQGGRRATKPLGGEAEQQAEGVAIPGDGVGTGPLLRDQSLGEESLEQRRKTDGLHWAPLGRCGLTSRSVANANSSGTASIYQ